MYAVDTCTYGAIFLFSPPLSSPCRGPEMPDRLFEAIRLTTDHGFTPPRITHTHTDTHTINAIHEWPKLFNWLNHYTHSGVAWISAVDGFFRPFMYLNTKPLRLKKLEHVNPFAVWFTTRASLVGLRLSFR